MTRTGELPLKWVVVGLLVVLVVINVVFVLLVKSKGPLIGVVFYAGLLVLSWTKQQQDFGAAMVGGVVGLAAHAIEIMTLGWSPYPSLNALNLILPAVLAPAAWIAALQARREQQPE